MKFPNIMPALVCRCEPKYSSSLIIANISFPQISRKGNTADYLVIDGQMDETTNKTARKDDLKYKSISFPSPENVNDSGCTIVLRYGANHKNDFVQKLLSLSSRLCVDSA